MRRISPVFSRGSGLVGCRGGGGGNYSCTTIVEYDSFQANTPFLKCLPLKQRRTHVRLAGGKLAALSLSAESNVFADFSRQVYGSRDPTVGSMANPTTGSSEMRRLRICLRENLWRLYVFDGIVSLGVRDLHTKKPSCDGFRHQRELRSW